MAIHKPLFAALLHAVWPYIAFVAVHCHAAGCGFLTLSWQFFGSFAAGLLYAHFFEWYFHNGPMHNSRCRWPKFIKDSVRLSHADHHSVFAERNFRTRDSESLKHITTRHHIFPVLLFVHYLIFVLLLPSEYAPAFFLGVTLHFICYEAGHWFTHVADNGFDNFLRKIPVIGDIREKQIRHHEIHHQEVLVNFNFTPPYGGDIAAKTKKSKMENLKWT